MCTAYALGVCLNHASPGEGRTILGFPEFLTALALLILVYNLSDARYRFRIQTAPVPLFPITFAITAAVGVGTLTTELWFAHSWLAPAWGLTRVDIQEIFASCFLVLVLVWTWFAFVSPAKFGRLNALRYTRSVYHYLMRGGSEQYDALSRELHYSSHALVSWAATRRTRQKKGKRAHLGDNSAKPRKPLTQDLALQVLGLLPHRPFCRYLAVQNPVSVIVLLRDAAEEKLFSPEIGQLLHQVSNAAIEDRESILYNEADIFTGIIGRLQSFKKAVYGNHELVDRSGHSALDLDYRLTRKMGGDQVEIYGECIAATFEDYVRTSRPLSPSSCLNRGIETLSNFTSDLYTLDQKEVYPSEPYEKTQAVMRTITSMIRTLDEADPEVWRNVPLRHRDQFGHETIYDEIASALFAIVTRAGDIAGPFWTTWAIQHNTIWSPLLRNDKGNDSAFWIVGVKLRRLMYDAIKRMEEFPNYEGARVLRFCLNVMAWSTDRSDHWPSEYPIRKAVLDWVCTNYAAVHATSSDVAKACLTDRMEYDLRRNRLVRRHERSILSPNRVDYLYLRRPRRKGWLKK